MDDHEWHEFRRGMKNEVAIVEMSEFMDEAETSDELKMIATNIERLKIKTSEASRIREWSNIGERFGEAALNFLKSFMSFVE